MIWKLEGLGRTLTCFHCDGVDDLDLYIMPEKGIEPSAIHGLSVSYSTGEKRLVNCKGELKDTVTAKYAASKLVVFVNQVMSDDTPVILVAHNGNSFYHDLLLSFLERKLKAKLDLPSCKLSDVYRNLFAEDFAAHDAVADVTALGRIIFHSLIATTLQSRIKITYVHLWSEGIK